MNNINEKNSLLGNKREKNDKNSNNNDSFSSSDSINDDKNSKNEKDNFKDLLSGKLEFGKSKTISNKVSIIKKDSNIKKTSQKNNNILSLLPPPKVKLTDKSNKISLSLITSCKMKSLINPDLLPINEKKELKNNIDPSQGEANEIESINQKDLIDKDWKRKYIDKINRAESLGIKEEEDNSNPMTNEHNIKNIIKKYNSEQSKALSSMEVKSKYGKISTKAKYGWQ